MHAYKVKTTLCGDGSLVLRNLPFHPGDDVEVIVLAEAQKSTAGVPDQGETKTDQATNLTQWLEECEQVAQMWQGDFDAVADVRRIREDS